MTMRFVLALAVCVLAALHTEGAAAQTLYYCDTWQAYYPGVRTCPVPWRAVNPATPRQPNPAAPPVAPIPEPSDPTVSAGYPAALSAWLESHKRYPDSARQRGEHGSVVLRFRVDRSGRVLNYAVVGSSGYGDLDASVEAMMRGAILPPFPPDMMASEIEASVTVRFDLAGPQPTKRVEAGASPLPLRSGTVVPPPPAQSGAPAPLDEWCAQVKLPSSIAVCSDGELRALATERQRAYDEARARLNLEQQKALLADQQGWVASYPPACGVARDVAPALPLSPAIKDCMIQAGRARIAYLKAYGATASGPVNAGATAAEGLPATPPDSVPPYRCRDPNNNFVYERSQPCATGDLTLSGPPISNSNTSPKTPAQAAVEQGSTPISPGAPQQQANRLGMQQSCFYVDPKNVPTPIDCAVNLGPGHPPTLSHTEISKTVCFVFSAGVKEPETTCADLNAAEAASGLNSANLNLNALWKTKISKTPCDVFSATDRPTITCASLDGTEAILVKMGYCYNPEIPSDGLVQDWHKCLPNERQVAPAPGSLSAQQVVRIVGSIGASPAHVEPTPPAATTAKGGSSCEEDWQRCVDNSDLVNNYSGWTYVQAACKTAIDDKVQYGKPKWRWFVSLSRFLKGDDYVKSGKAVAIDPDVQLQNMYGAMVHAKVWCTFDLRAKKVIGMISDPEGLLRPP
jgi:TonB family protein